MTSYRNIVALVWPLALGMINNAVMQFVDRAYLAHSSLGALEAVLPAGMLMWIFAGFFQSVIGYSSVFVGHYHGAKDPARCRLSFFVAEMLALAFGLVSLPLVPFGDWILARTAATPALLADERAYFDVIMFGAVFVYVQMAAASYFTGRGRTRIVFWANLLGNALNVALDPLLVFGWWGLPKMGIAGAAYATVFSMAVQCVLLVCAAHRERADGPILADRWPQTLELLRKFLRYGVPAGFYTVLNMASFTVFVFVTGGVGDLELAVSNACFTINYLIIAPMEGFSLGASTLVAQAIGRGNVDDAVHDARRTILLGVGFVALLSVVTLVFAHPILSLFAAEAEARSPAFHALGFKLLMLMAAWMLFDAVDVILSGAQKGAGDTKFVMGWMMFCAFGLWLPCVFAVRHFHNTMPALWSTMVGYVLVICIGSVVRWRRGKWKGVKLV